MIFTKIILIENLQINISVDFVTLQTFKISYAYIIEKCDYKIK